MSYEHMNTVGYLVVLRLPDEIQPEQGIRELGTCITFGQPSISLQYVIPDEIPEPEPACYQAAIGGITVHGPGCKCPP